MLLLYITTVKKVQGKSVYGSAWTSIGYVYVIKRWSEVSYIRSEVGL
jgi:hypothetical protein